jgi:hypothetical protein
MNTSADATERLKLPFIMPSQAQKHITHNEALWQLDSLVHAAIVTRGLTTPPAMPADGSCYIPAVASGGLWTGHDGELAIASGATWTFLAPHSGMQAYVEDEDTFVYHDGSAWAEMSSSLSTLQPDTLGVNTAADPAARLSVAADAARFSHDAATPGSGDVRLYLNKESAPKTASLLFQTNWSGRAEIGLAGDDNLVFKASANGSDWTTALRISATSGQVTVPDTLLIGASVASTNSVTIAKTSPTLSLRDTDGTGNTHTGLLNWVDADGIQKAWCGLGSTSNSVFTFLSQYPDGILFYAHGGNYPIVFRQHNSIRINVHSNGNVGIHEAAPTAPLHVAGAVRVGSYVVASVPSASALGAGAIIFVSNEAGGATLAFSDGTAWRRPADGAIVS